MATPDRGKDDLDGDDRYVNTKLRQYQVRVACCRRQDIYTDTAITINDGYSVVQ